MTEAEKQNKKSESFFSSVIWSKITDLESAEKAAMKGGLISVFISALSLRNSYLLYIDSEFDILSFILSTFLGLLFAFICLRVIWKKKFELIPVVFVASLVLIFFQLIKILEDIRVLIFYSLFFLFSLNALRGWFSVRKFNKNK
ncbi:hypothetical protein N9V56_00860 [Alphaproteobacteria bacterium]|nr:hypothetical protein [Alphaproteobacteria bacterium]